MVKGIYTLRLNGREFDSRPWRYRVTALGKLLTPMCLCQQAVYVGSSPARGCRGNQLILLGDRGTWAWAACPQLSPDSATAGNRTHYIIEPPTIHYRNQSTFVETIAISKRWAFFETQSSHILAVSGVFASLLYLHFLIFRLPELQRTGCFCRATVLKANQLMCRKPKPMHWFEYFLILSWTLCWKL